MSSRSDKAVDVLIICALAEEAQAVLAIFAKYASAIFSSDFHAGQEYQRTAIQSSDGLDISIIVTWLARYGPEDVTRSLQSWLGTVTPSMVLMTGICAGDRRKVQLGDIIVTERAFAYDTGKAEHDDEGKYVQRLDTQTWQIVDNIKHMVENFTGWKPLIDILDRPPSYRQQRDWILDQLMKPATNTVEKIVKSIPLDELTEHAPQWRTIFRDLQNSDTSILNSTGKLSKETIKNLQLGPEHFPHKDAPVEVHVKAMASGAMVRADDPFESINKVVRGTYALDMEAAAFMSAAANVPGTQALVVKGVSDYADRFKDDRFHRYAAEASALYALAFLREFFNSKRPSLRDHSTGAERSIQASASPLVHSPSVRTATSGNASLPHIKSFVRRQTLYDAILDTLINDPIDTLNPRMIALHGFGGFGKTTLAAKICQDTRLTAPFPDGILWTEIGDTHPPNLVGALSKLYEQLTGSPMAALDLEHARAQCARVLANKRCLIVLDDVWRRSDLTPFKEIATPSVWLITTRSAEVALDTHEIQINEMTSNEAIKMLMQGITASVNHAPFVNLAERLGNWPLVLELANRALRKKISNGLDLERALEQLALKDITTLDLTNETDRNSAVSRSLEVSLNLLENVVRQHYLELGIFPPDINIPLAAAAHLWGCDDTTAESIGEACNDLSLLTLNLAQRTLRIHKVIQSHLAKQQAPMAATLHARFLNSYRRGGRIDPAVDDPYIWDNLFYHLHKAELDAEFVATATDLRFLAEQIDRFGHAKVESDLRYADEHIADERIRTLVRSFPQLPHLYATCKNAAEIASTMVVRLLHLPALRAMCARLFVDFQFPCLVPQQPLPDLPHPALIRILVGHKNNILTGTISADGKTVISSSADLTVRIWDSQTGQQRFILPGYGVMSCAPSPDGKTVVLGAEDGSLLLLNIESGPPPQILKGHSKSVNACVIAPDNTIVSASADATVRIWEATGALRHVLDRHSGSVYACAISSDGRIIVSASADSTARVWDASSGEEILVLRHPKATGKEPQVTHCAISPDGSTIVSATTNGTLYLWDWKSGAQPRILPGHTTAILSCAFTTNTCIVSASLDNTVRIWDTSTGESFQIRSPHQNDLIGSMLGTPTTIVVSWDKSIQIWDVAGKRHQNTFEGHRQVVTHCMINTETRMLVSGSVDNTLRIWNISDQIHQPLRAAYAETSRCCTISGDGRWMVTGSPKGTVTVYDSMSATLQSTFQAHDQQVEACVLNHDGSTLTTASQDGTVRIWDTSSGEERLVLDHLVESILDTLIYEERSQVNTCAMHQDGSIVVSGTADGTIRIWVAGHRSHILSGHSRGVMSCAISADGATIISAAYDQTVCVWKTHTGELTRRFAMGDRLLTACAINADTGLIAAGFENGSVELWNINGQRAAAIMAHAGKVAYCAMSPTAQAIASVSTNGTLRIWNIATGDMSTPVVVDGSLECCAWHPDGEHVIAGGDRGVYWFRLVHTADQMDEALRTYWERVDASASPAI